MDLPRDGREYATIRFSAYPGAGYVCQASVDRQTWVDLDVQPSEQADGTWLGKALLYGPDFADHSEGILVRGPRTHLWVRVTADPEVVPRNAGEVRLV